MSSSKIKVVERSLGDDDAIVAVLVEVHRRQKGRYVWFPMDEHQRVVDNPLLGGDNASSMIEFKAAEAIKAHGVRRVQYHT